jgi:hypothetical protein
MDNKELEAKIRSIVDQYNSYKTSSGIVVEHIVNDALGLIQSLVQEIINLQKEVNTLTDKQNKDKVSKEDLQRLADLANSDKNKKIPDKKTK